MKKLIIVCEEKYRRYGDFLAQLISGTDDQAEMIIGIKDGSAAAQVWTEKEYSSNAAQISSEQYLLFIGNSKLIKEKRHHMRKMYSEYGMNYGWLGKQAVLFVDRMLTVSEYEDFYQCALDRAAESNQPEMVRLLPEKIESTEQETDGAFVLADLGDNAIGGIRDILDKTDLDEKAIEFGKKTKDALGAAAVAFKENLIGTDETPEAAIEVSEPDPEETKGFFASLGAAKDAIMKAADQGMNAISKMTDNISVAAKGKEIEEQQYTCLVLLFYLKDLGNFLGLNED